MNATLSLSLGDSSALAGLESAVAWAVGEAQAAMAARYGEIVRSNFGESGLDRPSAWPPLSPSYAKEVGRTYATLFVSGALFSAVRVDAQDARVSASNADAPYATAHQFGNPAGNLPARPYFPVAADGGPTEYTRGEVLAAAAAALGRALP